MNSLLSEPALLITSHRHITVKLFLQREGHFVILAPKVYQIEFNTGYTVEEATNFAYYA